MMDQGLKILLARVELENREGKSLYTSLLDTVQFPYDEFKDPYYLRWNEEEAYKSLKARAELEVFSGKAARAVE